MTQEKSYSYYMDEITSTDIYERFLAYGLFTEKLPPVFTSEPFFLYCQKKKFTFSEKFYDYMRYESMRNSNVPRIFGIPNPMAYERLCRMLGEAWDEIRRKLKENTSGQTHKISRIHIRKRKSNKALFEMNYKNWRVDSEPVLDMLIGSRYVVKADISTCFPSIYTHSICWALVGQHEAKAKRGEKQWYNRIDKACQALRNGETHGLIIGPHASNLLSEIILTAVDQKLYEKGYTYIRNIDDYTCFVPNVERAAEFLIDLRSELSCYDLILNHKKTKVEALPAALVADWVRQLSVPPAVEHYGQTNYKTARNYLDLAIKLMPENQMNSAILKYAIKVIAKCKFTYNARAYCIKTILHLAVIYPYLVSMLEQYVFIPLKVETELINDFTQSLFNESVRIKNYEGMCYALYFSMKYGVELEQMDVNLSISCNQCIFKLCSWLYYKRLNSDGHLKLIENQAEELLNNDEIDRNWLFIYEVLSKDCFQGEWKALKKRWSFFFASGI